MRKFIGHALGWASFELAYIVYRARTIRARAKAAEADTWTKAGADT